MLKAIIISSGQPSIAFESNTLSELTSLIEDALAGMPNPDGTTVKIRQVRESWNEQ